jgi:CheY-like chemotaxis protein
MAREKRCQRPSIAWKFLMVNRRSPPIAPERPRILVIEDDFLIAQMIEEMVREADYRVSGVAHTMAMARQEFAKRNFDAVLFDLEIGRRSHPEIADFLWDIGVPFAFVTGYDYLVEPRHQAIYARAASCTLGKASRVGITDRRNR